MSKLVAVAFVLGMAMPAVAAAPAFQDVSGTWSIAGEVQGVQVVETCTLAQAEDGKLSGSCDTASGKKDAKGAATEKGASFTHAGEYEGNALTLTYTGTVGSDGLMTGTVDVAPFDVTGSFSARKVPAK